MIKNDTNQPSTLSNKSNGAGLFLLSYSISSLNNKLSWNCNKKRHQFNVILLHFLTLWINFNSIS